MLTKITIISTYQVLVKYFSVLCECCVENVFDVRISFCTDYEAYCFCVSELVWRLDGVKVGLYRQVSDIFDGGWGYLDGCALLFRHKYWLVGSIV